MRILVKVGGTLLDVNATRTQLAGELAGLVPDHELVVVHGGGKQMTRFLEERGVTSRFANGLRVSDEAVVDAATKVIAGSVNRQLVTAFAAAGRLAVGLSGIDGNLVLAARMGEDLGFVGDPVRANAGLLQLLVDGGYLPVVACIAGDGKGTIYNVNADAMAVSCAIAWRAEKLVFLTDVAGVRDAAGQVVSHLLACEIPVLIQSGVAHGGMRAKLEAAALALNASVAEVIIAPGHAPKLAEKIAGAQDFGTRLLLSPAAEKVAL